MEYLTVVEGEVWKTQVLMRTNKKSSFFCFNFFPLQKRSHKLVLLLKHQELRKKKSARYFFFFFFCLFFFLLISKISYSVAVPNNCVCRYLARVSNGTQKVGTLP